MNKHNFFNLNAIHPVINQFIEDHDACIKSHDLNREFLNEFDENGYESDFLMLIEFYREVYKNYFEMQNAWHNFMLSYYSFKTTAATNEEVKKEFDKLPPSQEGIKKYFDQLLASYATIIEQLKKEL